MITRTLAAAAVAAAVAASTATAAHQTLKACGTVKAGGWTFHVSAVRVDCASARAITRKLAARGVPGKPTPYPGTYARLRCFGAAAKSKGIAQIQCTSSDGRATVLSIAKR